MNSRLGDTEECTSDLEDRIMEITKSEQQNEKQIKNNEDSLRKLCGNINSTNICIIGFPEGEKREKGQNVFDEIMAENFPNLKKETDIQ